MYWKNYFTTIAVNAVFVSGEMEIRKIFYTLECVWVRIKIQSNWKSISVDCKLNPLDLEIGLHSDFTFNQFPLSSLTHQAEGTRERERERERPSSCHRRSTSATASTCQPVAVSSHWTASAIASTRQSAASSSRLSSLFSLPLFILSLSLRPTKAEFWIACHRSTTHHPPTPSPPQRSHCPLRIYFFIANNICSWGWWIGGWDGFF